MARLSLALLWGALASGCGDDPNEPARHPADPSTRVTEAVRALLEQSEVPGVSVAVVDARGVRWSAGYGLANVERRVPVTPDTSFWLASVSKAMMGLGIMGAVEDGSLRLDMDVDALLDERGAFDLGFSHEQPVTLSHLVTHRSAIRDAENYACSYYVGEEDGPHVSLANELLGDAACDDSAAVDLAGFLASYLGRDGEYFTPDNFADEEPGTSFEYSNVGAALTGHVLELATGSSLADFEDERIFAPLGLEHTSWRLADLDPEGIATPYIKEPEGAANLALPLYSLSTWPDGGLRSSANDLGRMLAAVIGRGELDGVRILEEQSVVELLAPRAAIAEGADIGVFWVLSELTLEDGSRRRAAWHTGGDPGASSFMLFDRDTDVGVLLLANGELDGENQDTQDLVDQALIRLLALADELHR